MAIMGSSQGRPSVVQSWNQVQLIVPVSRSTDSEGTSVNNVTAIIEGIARFGRDADLTDARLGVEFDFRANKHLTIARALSTVAMRLSRTSSASRHGSPLTDIFCYVEYCFVPRPQPLRVSSSERRNDISVYRHRLQISVPVKHEGKVIFSPFLSEEAFYTSV
jgi:hypothetical protein